MKLSDIEIKNAATLNNKMRESLGWNLNLQAMTPYKASEMMESIDNKLSLVRNSHKIHASQRNSSYMGMILARQVLESYIAETSNNINEGISSAIDRREKSRQRAIKKAVAWVKRTGKSASDAAIEFDLLPGDVKHINKHLSEAELKKKSKPDYLDFDKDGNTKEPMKKALKDKKKKKVSESRLMEDELSQAQSILAAKDMVDSLQDMIQEVSKMLNEQLPPLVDSIRASIGSAEADAFKNAASQVLQGLLTQVQSDRETMDQTVRSLSGEPAPVAVPAVGQPPDMDLDYEDEIDDFSASDAAAGGSLPMGREKRD